MTVDLLEKNEAPVSAGEDDVRQYLNEIRRYPRLDPQEERELAMLCAQGDADAIRRMVNANLRLVVSVAREYAGRGVPLLDLIQEGSIGLLVAAKKFDYTLDFRFSTYATKWIRQGVSRCILNSGGMIRVPLHTQDKMRRVITARQKLLQETGEEPSAAEIAQRCDMPADKVAVLLQLSPQVCSLDAPTGEENGTLALMLPDVQSLQPQEELIRRELNKTLEQLLSQLQPRQKQVLQLHFGLEDGLCHSLEEIGKLLGISKERARQVEKQAMEKLKTLGADFGLEDFLND